MRLVIEILVGMFFNMSEDKLNNEIIYKTLKDFFINLETETLFDDIKIKLSPYSKEVSDYLLANDVTQVYYNFLNPNTQLITFNLLMKLDFKKNLDSLPLIHKTRYI